MSDSADGSGSVFQAMLDWSQSRPKWQRDALRRIVTSGSLDNLALQELVALCKAPHGLAEEPIPSATPLGAEHIPSKKDASRRVELAYIHHIEGVNALAANQTLSFGPALTVVYGDNGSGKSGYTRILKNVCRTRSKSTKVLPNVRSEALPVKPSARLSYRDNNHEHQFMWSADAPPPEPLRQISVFDSEAAAVYLGEKTDTAFRPAGLEVFDLLAQACDAVKRLLEAELASEKAFSLPTLPSGTEAGDLVQRLSGMTEDRVVERLASLDETQRARLTTLRETLAVPQDESGSAARAAQLQAKRIRSLLATIDEAHSLLSTERLKALHALLMSARDAEREAGQLQEIALGSCIPGTGGERWRRLWAAAADFSREPFPSSTFPSTERCLLCQQELSEEARTRLVKLAEYMASEARAKSARSRELLQKDRAAITSRRFAAERAVELDDLRLSSSELTSSVERYFASAESLRTKVADEEFIAEQIGLPAFELRQELALLAASFDEKALATEAARSAEERGKLQREFNELAAREELARSKEIVFAELRRIRRRLAIEQPSVSEKLSPLPSRVERRA